MRWLDSIIDSMDMNLSKLQEIVGFPDSSGGKESAHNAGDPGLISGSGRSAGERIGYPLQYSWISLVAQLVKNLTAMRETISGGSKIMQVMTAVMKLKDACSLDEKL